MQQRNQLWVVGAFCVAAGLAMASLEAYADQLGSGGAYGIIETVPNGAAFTQEGDITTSGADINMALGDKICFDDDDDSCLYGEAANNLSFDIGGSEVMDITGGSLRGQTNYDFRLNGAGAYLEWNSGTKINGDTDGQLAISNNALDADATAVLDANNDMLEVDKTIAPEQVTGDTVAEPHACDATHFGAIVAVNDTNDTAVSSLCYCGQQSDDSTYDWLEMDDTACPHF